MDWILYAIRDMGSFYLSVPPISHGPRWLMQLQPSHSYSRWQKIEKKEKGKCVVIVQLLSV